MSSEREGPVKLPHRRQFLHLAAGVAAFPAMSRTVWAQTYPSRPITIVVGFAAGGATDTIGRVIAERMKGSLGQPVIVENVTGAGGTIGIGRVARATPTVSGPPRRIQVLVTILGIMSPGLLES